MSLKDKVKDISLSIVEIGLVVPLVCVSIPVLVTAAIYSYPTVTKLFVGKYKNSGDILGATCGGSFVGTFTSLWFLYALNEDPDSLNHCLDTKEYLALTALPLLTNTITGACEYCYFKYQKKINKNKIQNNNDSENINNKQDTLETRIETIENESIDTFINPWDIDIPKLDNKIMKNYSGGYN